MKHATPAHNGCVAGPGPSLEYVTHAAMARMPACNQHGRELYQHWLQLPPAAMQVTGHGTTAARTTSACDMPKQRQCQRLQATHLYVLKAALRRGASCRQ
jgi:hypothetical protein